MEITHINIMEPRNISTITEDELIEIWLMIGGTPHMFNETQMRNWLNFGEVPEGIEFGACEIIPVGIYLYSKGFNADSRSEWDLTSIHETINNIQQHR